MQVFIMVDSTVFLETVRQQGYAVQYAQRALTTIATKLQECGHATNTYFYIYRTGKSGMGGDEVKEHPRTVLAFATADSAFSFVQRNHLKSTPRLWRASLAQLLAVLVQRPTIGALLFAHEPIEINAQNRLPIGLRIERTDILKMLEGA
jgi:hypothetical protein